MTALPADESWVEFTVKEFAAREGVSERQVYRWIHEKKAIPHEDDCPAVVSSPRPVWCFRYNVGGGIRIYDRRNERRKQRRSQIMKTADIH